VEQLSQWAQLVDLYFMVLKDSVMRHKVTSIRQKATLTGAGFAAWGGMFSVVDCSLAHIRKKEDAWNSVGSGFITGGLLQIRRSLCLSIEYC